MPALDNPIQCVLVDVWNHKNGRDILGRVEDDQGNSFIAIVPRVLHHLLDKIKKATSTLMVLVSRWYGINMPAIIEVAEEQLAPVEPSPAPTLAAEATIDVEHFQDEDVLTLQKARELWEVAQINLNTLGIFLKRVGV